jgi:hypothetical protein
MTLQLPNPWFEKGDDELARKIQENFEAIALALPGAQGLRFAAGSVTAAGAILTVGTGGWTVVRNGVGDYTITFTSPFDSVHQVPVFGVFDNGAGAARPAPSIFAITASTIRYFTFNLAGALADVAVSFHVFGPT